MTAGRITTNDHLTLIANSAQADLIKRLNLKLSKIQSYIFLSNELIPLFNAKIASNQALLKKIEDKMHNLTQHQNVVNGAIAAQQYKIARFSAAQPKSDALKEELNKSADVLLNHLREKEAHQYTLIELQKTYNAISNEIEALKNGVTKQQRELIKSREQETRLKSQITTELNKALQTKNAELCTISLLPEILETNVLSELDDDAKDETMVVTAELTKSPPSNKTKRPNIPNAQGPESMELTDLPSDVNTKKRKHEEEASGPSKKLKSSNESPSYNSSQLFYVLKSLNPDHKNNPDPKDNPGLR